MRHSSLTGPSPLPWRQRGCAAAPRVPPMDPQLVASAPQPLAPTLRRLTITRPRRSPTLVRGQARTFSGSASCKGQATHVHRVKALSERQADASSALGRHAAWSIKLCHPRACAPCSRPLFTACSLGAMARSLQRSHPTPSVLTSASSPRSAMRSASSPSTSRIASSAPDTCLCRGAGHANKPGRAWSGLPFDHDWLAGASRPSPGGLALPRCRA